MGGVRRAGREAGGSRCGRRSSGCATAEAAGGIGAGEEREEGAGEGAGAGAAGSEATTAGVTQSLLKAAPLPSNPFAPLPIPYLILRRPLRPLHVQPPSPLEGLSPPHFLHLHEFRPEVVPLPLPQHPIIWRWGGEGRGREGDREQKRGSEGRREGGGRGGQNVREWDREHPVVPPLKPAARPPISPALLPLKRCGSHRSACARRASSGIRPACGTSPPRG